MTPSYERICGRFRSFITGNESADVGHLVLALLCEESLGGKFLSDVGVTMAGIAEGCFGAQAADTASMLIEDGGEAMPPVLPFRQTHHSSQSFERAPWFQLVHERAGSIAKRNRCGPAEISSEHLLQAMIEVSGPARTQLVSAGVDAPALLTALTASEEPATETKGLQVDFQLQVESADHSQTLSIDTPPINKRPMPEWSAHDSKPKHQTVCNRNDQGSESDRVMAILDANLNRSREGLRVLEDFARFVQRDRAVTTDLKKLRHDLVAAEGQLRKDLPELIKARNVAADAGTAVTTSNETVRNGFSDVLIANARRVQESLRSLEEFGKIVSPRFAAVIKQLRYKSYRLEQCLNQQKGVIAATTANRRRDRLSRLAAARLYVLVTESACNGSWKQVVLAALKGGADVIQLREKTLSDDELICRSHWIADVCQTYGALFILNDRVDLAAACRADGVHLGQEDSGIHEARQQLDSGILVGVSTHNLQQLKDACANQADYLGVGPVFPSGTKSFDHFPGMEFVAEANAHAMCPWFAIGGINHRNIDRLTACGADRIAVCGAVIGEEDPQASAAYLKSCLAAVNDVETLPFQDT